MSVSLSVGHSFNLSLSLFVSRVSARMRLAQTLHHSRFFVLYLLEMLLTKIMRISACMLRCRLKSSLFLLFLSPSTPQLPNNSLIEHACRGKWGRLVSPRVCILYISVGEDLSVTLCKCVPGLCVSGHYMLVYKRI